MKREIKYSFNVLLALSIMTFTGCGSDSVKKEVETLGQSEVKSSVVPEVQTATLAESTQTAVKVSNYIPVSDVELGEEEEGGGTTPADPDCACPAEPVDPPVQSCPTQECEQETNPCPPSTECECASTECPPADDTECGCSSECECDTVTECPPSDCDCPTEEPCMPILPQTGQTASFYEGDDGNLTKGVARAFDRNDSTNIVTDLATGLVWEDIIIDDDKTWEQAKTYCTTLGEGWRLPLQEELIHLVNRGTKSPSIYHPPFLHTFSDYYWSSEKNAFEPSEILGVSFDDGDQWSVDASDDWAKIRCVKGESITHDFQRDDDKEVVVDTKTCLMWQDDGNVSDDEDGFKTWEGALDYCNNLDHAGYNSGWRLPNYTELISIVDRSRNASPVANTEFEHTSDWAAYWTSTTYFDVGDIIPSAWYIEFENGMDGVEQKKVDWFLVRCVRDNKPLTPECPPSDCNCDNNCDCPIEENCNECTDDNIAPVADMINRGYIPNSDQEIKLLASDVDGDDLTFTIVEGPEHGTVTFIGGPKNIAVYTPETDYSGDDSFTYKVNDGCLDSNIGKVTLLASTPI